jgi:dipeptide/tripeptide permease
MDGGWTENTFSFNSSFQVNQCLISFGVFFFFFGENWHSGNQRKKKPIQLSCKGILLEKMSQIFARFRE